ncbi:MAG: OmpH family outer membrane protein [Bacteroidota bacterium]|nr:OmpH family outer membrane protein [Bacteroidota bacterium]MDX5405301.1 OmpH family outer membrane protein [Bacteroidota bacterium]MDX5427680.1 OmpH family outer membrane protein [Bacteroidota bacterium]MDX5505577.1 OmpH family outer membrane protein [Bacteroidota bacterium]
MIKKIAFLFFGLIFANSVFGQRFAYVDSDFILSQIPEYNQAQEQLDQLSKKWEGEIASLYSEVEALRQAYQAEKVLLTEEMQKEREAIIARKEQEARNLQLKYFGADGELFKKRKELVKPIQDQVYNAVQEVARRRKLDFVFDKSSELIMLYANPDNDVSDEVLEKLGYRR